MRGFEDKQIFNVLQLTLYAGNNIGATACDAETLVGINVAWNQVLQLRMPLGKGNEPFGAWPSCSEAKLLADQLLGSVQRA